MDVVGSLRTVRRRWPLALLLFLLTMAGTAAVAVRPGPYQAESQVVLLPSAKISKPNGYNPYLSFDSSITLTADLVRRKMMDPRTALALAAQGYSSSYQVVDDPATAGPVLDITVTGNNRAGVEHTLQGATARISTELAGMQVRVGRAGRITSLVVSTDPRASLVVSKKARPVVVVLVIGLVLSIAIPQAADAAVATRRRRRREADGYRDQHLVDKAGAGSGRYRPTRHEPTRRGARSGPPGMQGNDDYDVPERLRNLSL